MLHEFKLERVDYPTGKPYRKTLIKTICMGELKLRELAAQAGFIDRVPLILCHQYKLNANCFTWNEIHFTPKGIKLEIVMCGSIF